MPPTVTPMSILPDGSFALYADSDSWRNMRVLATTPAAENIHVPTGAKYAVFAATGDFCARYNTTTTGGTAASFADADDGTACEINPTIRFIRDTVKAISVISPTGPTRIGVTFYK